MDDFFFEYEEQEENEDDITASWNQDIDNAVMSGSDWTTETILNQIDKGNIILNPSFQRRSAWTVNRKSEFIESIILGLPIPQIVLAQTKESKGRFIVLDGKQRLLSIRSFAEENEDGDYKVLKLRGLKIRNDLNGKSLKDLHADDVYETDLSSFENQTIRTVIIRNWPNENFLYHVFLRLNTGSVKLSPQELRQALHPGGFLDYVNKVSEEFLPIRKILKKDEPDFRMRDTELLIRFIAFKHYILQYRGNLKQFLDLTCKDLNQKWETHKKIIENDILEFENAFNYLSGEFKDNLFHKYTPGGYENRFNRAIFDVFMYYFTDKNVRDNTDCQKLKDAFEKLCIENTDFIRSIEQTTKSISATQNRFRTFGEAVNQIGKIQVNIPMLQYDD